MKLRLPPLAFLALALPASAFLFSSIAHAAEAATSAASLTTAPPSTLPAPNSSATTLAPVTPAAVDALFAAWDKPTTPGCALAVISDGRIIYERGYGSADLEHELPITPATVFYVGSDSKQFTAACIALLAQRGKLSLDDDVRKYVPEVPAFGPLITIRHLVHHTSGLRDYLELRALAGEPADASFDDADVLTLISRQKALNFAPGTDYLYSNTGYFLLGLVVKRVSGQSLRDFAAANIFRPLGMTTAQFRDDHTALIKNRAHGYLGRAPAIHLSNPNFDVIGAGGVFMTVRDFLPWDQNFYTPKVGDRDFLTLIQTPAKLNNGAPTTYAFGLQVTRYRGLPIVEHSGAYGGFRAHLLRFPEQRFSVACFANLGSMEPGKLARQVADLYLASALRARDLTGTFGVTAANPPSSESPPAPNPAAASAPASKKAPAPKKKAAASLTLSSDQLSAYTGDFLSDELQTVFHFTVKNGQLLAQGGRRGTAILTATKDDVFTAPGWELAFERTADGRVASFVLNAGRVRSLHFARK